MSERKQTSRRFTKKHLMRQCEILERSIRARELATDEELDAHRPDGPKANKEEWIRWFANLHAFRRREEWYETSREEATEIALDGLRDVPVTVQLLAGRTVRVHPKGLDALLWFRAKDLLVEFLGAWAEALENALTTRDLSDVWKGDMSPPKALEAARREVGYQLAGMAEEACVEGTALSEDAGEPSPEFVDLDPIDVMRIHKAYAEVNAGRLRALEALTKPSGPKEGGGRRVSWDVFHGTMSMKLRGDPRELARDRSLVSLVMQSRLAQASGPDLEDLEETMGAT